jgi:hypothetical protein
MDTRVAYLKNTATLDILMIVRRALGDQHHSSLLSCADLRRNSPGRPSQTGISCGCMYPVLHAAELPYAVDRRGLC